MQTTQCVGDVLKWNVCSFDDPSHPDIEIFKHTFKKGTHIGRQCSNGIRQKPSYQPQWRSLCIHTTPRVHLHITQMEAQGIQVWNAHLAFSHLPNSGATYNTCCSYRASNTSLINMYTFFSLRIGIFSFDFGLSQSV